MKIETTCKALKEALSKVAPASSTKIGSAALHHVKMLAMDGTLTITATNLDLVIIDKIEVTVVKDGAIAIDFEKIKSIFDGSTSVVKVEEIKGGEHPKAKISIGAFHRTVPCLKLSDLPKYMAPKKDTVESAVPGDLISLGSESMTPFTYGVEGNLAGVNYQKSSDGHLTIQATNKNVIARKTISASVSFESFTIPLVTAVSLSRIVPDSEDVAISVDESCVSFKWSTGEIRSKIYEGNYPGLNGPLTRAFENNAPWIEVSSVELVRALPRVLSAHEFSYVALEAKASMLKISAGMKGDDAEDLIPVSGVEMDRVRVNGDYLTNAIKACQTERIEISRTVNSLSLRSSDKGFVCLIAQLTEQ